MKKLELELHPEKTKLVNLWNGKEGFDFLVFHHRRTTQESKRGKFYQITNQFPSKKAMKSMKEKIKLILSNRATLKQPLEEMVKRINRRLVGFKNYYALKYTKKYLSKIDWYVVEKFTIWNNDKRQRKPRRRGMKEININLKKYGIVKLASLG